MSFLLKYHLTHTQLFNYYLEIRWGLEKGLKKLRIKILTCLHFVLIILHSNLVYLLHLPRRNPFLNNQPVPGAPFPEREAERKEPWWGWFPAFLAFPNSAEQLTEGREEAGQTFLPSWATFTALVHLFSSNFTESIQARNAVGLHRGVDKNKNKDTVAHHGKSDQRVERRWAGIEKKSSGWEEENWVPESDFPLGTRRLDAKKKAAPGVLQAQARVTSQRRGAHSDIRSNGSIQLPTG